MAGGHGLSSVRLRRLTGGIMIAGGVAAGAVLLLHEDDLNLPGWMLPLQVVLVAVANAAVVRVRVRSTVVGASWTDAAALVCIVCLPPAWVPVCVGLGVLLAKLLSQVPPYKSCYNAAKDTLAATAGLLVAIALGVSNVSDPLDHPVALVAVAITISLVENLIGVPVLALASAVRWHKVHVDVDMKAVFFAGKLVVSVLFLFLMQLDVRLLAIIPPVALALHLLYSGRVRHRSERAAWQRLATTADELNRTDLAEVLAAAVTNASKLFSADWAEVYLRDGPDGPIFVRGTAEGVTWSGDPAKAPAREHDGESVIARLTGPDLKADAGEVRLYYAGRVSLTDRERLTLRTFVTALRTAIRNASAFAEAHRMDLRNAHAATHDPLTGLANRVRLQEFGASVIEEAVLVVIDLDRFRVVNEALGHLAGDRVLGEVARRMVRATGGQPPAGGRDLVARLGADEFAVLLVGDAPARLDPLQRARELLATLDAPVELGKLRVRVEASAGVAVSDPVPSTGPIDAEARMVELLRRADVAMFQAKRGGPKVVAYDPARDPADLAALSLGGDLPRAIAERQITVHLQPIVDLTTGMMLSAEALARWHHPDQGYLSPLRFLGTVERSGLLPAFAESILDQALAARRQWRSLGITGAVAVNASPRSLLDPEFPDTVARLLTAHGLSGDALVIEITETMTSSQAEAAAPVLARLRQLGVGLALDDFGTASSSLALLAKVPVSEVKIDRSFVSAMDSSPEALAVVRSTVELGRSLELLVVAEGVESPEQRQTLRELGCPAGQGYLFARPLPVDELLQALRTGVDGVPGRLYRPVPATQG